MGRRRFSLTVERSLCPVVTALNPSLHPTRATLRLPPAGEFQR